MKTANPFVPAPALSPRQRQLCETIERLTAANGYPPSVREAAVAMGVHPSRVAQLAASTRAKGHLAHNPKVARSWRVVKPATSKRGG